MQIIIGVSAFITISTVSTKLEFSREQDDRQNKVKNSRLRPAKRNLPGFTGVAVEAGVVPKAKVGAGVDVDAAKPLPNDIPITGLFHD